MGILILRGRRAEDIGAGTHLQTQLLTLARAAAAAGAGPGRALPAPLVPMGTGCERWPKLGLAGTLSLSQFPQAVSSGQKPLLQAEMFLMEQGRVLCSAPVAAGQGGTLDVGDGK